MLADAQTSGGLLFSVPINQSDKLISNLKQNGAMAHVVIGQVFKKADTHIYVN